MSFVILIASIIIITAISYTLQRNKALNKDNYLRIFKRRSNKRNSLISKFKSRHYNLLLKSPELSIEISTLEPEDILREKASIHRLRLEKFGQSKMNNITYYKGPRGGIYIYTESGRKKYI